MTTHIKAFTYVPKIPSVLDGTIRQTIRPLGKTPIKVGDKIIFHGWSGKPYRSPWSWRKELVVTEVFYFTAYPTYVDWDDIWASNYSKQPWSELDYYAKLDGISPPTGEALRELMCDMYLDKMPLKMQIIRW